MVSLSSAPSKAPLSDYAILVPYFVVVCSSVSNQVFFLSEPFLLILVLVSHLPVCVYGMFSLLLRLFVHLCVSVLLTVYQCLMYRRNIRAIEGVKKKGRGKRCFS